jgi:hypothetical protein
MEEIQAVLVYIRSTKNKHVYGDDSEGGFGSIYIPKQYVPADPPITLVLTIAQMEG